MCKYCERKANEHFGMKQPALPYHNPLPMNSLSGNVLDNEKWNGYIRDYQTMQPQLSLMSVGYFDGQGIGTINIPINYYPHCGRKLGKNN